MRIYAASNHVLEELNDEGMVLDGYETPNMPNDLPTRSHTQLQLELLRAISLKEATEIKTVMKQDKRLLRTKERFASLL